MESFSGTRDREYILSPYTWAVESRFMLIIVIVNCHTSLFFLCESFAVLKSSSSSSYRIQNLSMVKQAVKDTIEMQKRYPEIIAGFDLVKSPN